MSAAVLATEENILPSRHEQAGDIIASAVRWSAASGAIPLPIVDSVALAVVQTRMIMDLSELYGERASKETARGLVSVLLGTLLPSVGAKAVISSTMKMTPIIGVVGGMATMALLGSAASYAIGKVFVRHFENGGTLTSFDAGSIKDELKEEFAKGKAKAAQI